MKLIETGDVRIATETFGSPGDPALVLAMGATATMLFWPDELCRALAERGHFVIRYDTRDTGLSTSWPPGQADYDAEDMARDLIGVMDGHAVDAAHLVGMSLGGYVAQMVALRWPDRVRTLTLIGSEPLGWDGAPLPGIAPVFMEHFGAMADLDWSDDASVEAFLLEIARLSASPNAAFDVEGAQARIRGDIARSPSLVSAFNHGALGTREDWTGAYRHITQPVLVLHGEDDPILPLPNGRALVSGIPGARLRVLERTGHELPARALGTITDAIAGLTGAT